MLLAIVIFTLQRVCAGENVIVHTQYGDVMGYQTDMSRIFYAIPFAQPPVGTLR